MNYKILNVTYKRWWYLHVVVSACISNEKASLTVTTNSEPEEKIIR